jgi:F0F1-type ATP synthase membrane subunit b/b'
VARVVGTLDALGARRCDGRELLDDARDEARRAGYAPDDIAETEREGIAAAARDQMDAEIDAAMERDDASP